MVFDLDDLDGCLITSRRGWTHAPSCICPSPSSWPSRPWASVKDTTTTCVLPSIFGHRQQLCESCITLSSFTCLYLALLHMVLSRGRAADCHDTLLLCKISPYFARWRDHHVEQVSGAGLGLDPANQIRASSGSPRGYHDNSALLLPQDCVCDDFSGSRDGFHSSSRLAALCGVRSSRMAYSNGLMLPGMSYQPDLHARVGGAGSLELVDRLMNIALLCFLQNDIWCRVDEN